MEAKARKAGMITLGIGAIGLLITVALGCDHRSFLEGRDHAWSSWKRHHEYRGKDFPEHLLKHLDGRVQALKLTELQQEQYAAIRQKIKSELIRGREERRRVLERVRTEMNKDLPDVHEAAGMFSEHLEMLPGALDKYMGMFLEFYEILDEPQRAEVIEHFRDRLNRIPSHAGQENPGGSIQNDTPHAGSKSGETISSDSLSDQMARKRGDRHGELL